MPRAPKRKLESEFQADLIKEIEYMLPDAVVMKQDANYRQGMPDLIILNDDRWACLEVKAAEDAEHQPNQDYWVDRLEEMSFAAFICPENKDVVLQEMFPFLGMRNVTPINRVA